MPVSTSDLWDQVASRLGPGVDVEVAQRALLRAVGYKWDAVTGKLTSWPEPLPVVSPRPRHSQSPGPGADQATVDLVSPDGCLQENFSSFEFLVQRRGPRSPHSPTTSIAVSDSEERISDRGKHKRNKQMDGDVTQTAGTGKQSQNNPPSFTHVSDKELENELKKHGMKPGPKGYMRSELTKMWAAGAALSDRFFTLETCRQALAETTGVRLETTTGKHSKNNKTNVPLPVFLGRFIKANKQLYDKVLIMETLDVDDLMKLIDTERSLKMDSIPKVPRTKLLQYLEQQGVAVCVTSKRQKNQGHF